LRNSYYEERRKKKTEEKFNLPNESQGLLMQIKAYLMRTQFKQKISFNSIRDQYRLFTLKSILIFTDSFKIKFSEAILE